MFFCSYVLTIIFRHHQVALNCFIEIQLVRCIYLRDKRNHKISSTSFISMKIYHYRIIESLSCSLNLRDTCIWDTLLQKLNRVQPSTSTFYCFYYTLILAVQPFKKELMNRSGRGNVLIMNPHFSFFFNSPELKAQVSFSDRLSSVVCLAVRLSVRL